MRKATTSSNDDSDDDGRGLSIAPVQEVAGRVALTTTTTSPPTERSEGTNNESSSALGKARPPSVLGVGAHAINSTSSTAPDVQSVSARGLSTGESAASAGSVGSSSIRSGRRNPVAEKFDQFARVSVEEAGATANDPADSSSVVSAMASTVGSARSRQSKNATRYAEKFNQFSERQLSADQQQPSYSDHQKGSDSTPNSSSVLLHTEIDRLEDDLHEKNNGAPIPSSLGQQMKNEFNEDESLARHDEERLQGAAAVYAAAPPPQSNDSVLSGNYETSNPSTMNDAPMMGQQQQGAHEVDERAFGERPDWSQNPPSGLRRSAGRMSAILQNLMPVAAEVREAETVAYAEHVTKEDLPPARKRHTKLIVIVVGIVVVAIIIGVVVGVTTKSDSSDSSQAAGAAPILNPCEDNPNVRTQCGCNDTIYFLTDDLVAGFENITNALNATGISTTQDNVTICEPSIVARYWLATQEPMTTLDLHQRYALSVFYLTLNGDSWFTTTNWMSLEKSVCDNWSGVSCDDNGIVDEIQLASSNLQGTLPSEIAILTHLEDFRVDENRISGTIPAEITDMVIHTFAIEENFIAGPFEAEKFPESIRNIRIHTNKLTGSIPSTLDNLFDLRRFVIHSNQLTGTLPPQLSVMQDVRFLDLSFNNFAGSLPEEFSVFRSIETFVISNNSLTGTLPESYVNLDRLQTFRFEGNQFEGQVPEIWCDAMQPDQIAGDCGPTFSANCSCCQCWLADLDLKDGTRVLKGKS